MTELRIPARPQRWLWWANAFLQLPLAVLSFWVVMAATESDFGMKVFMASLGLCFLALWVFSVRTLLLLRGEPMFVIVAADHIVVPSMWSRATVTIRYNEIEKAILQEIDGGAVSFLQLVFSYRDDNRTKSIVIPQQLIGIDALEQVQRALQSRGVAVG